MGPARPIAAALLVLLAGAVSGAQQPATPGPQSPVPGSQVPVPAPGSDPTFRVAVDLVSSDVIVRNKAGLFVGDLTKDDFEIYEDGVLQDITSFTLIRGGRAYATVSAPQMVVQEGILLPASRPTNDVAGRIIIFVIDDLHLEFRDTSRIRALFRKMAKELVHEGDLFGIVSTGTSSIAIDLTYDRGRLEEAANKISGGGLRPSEIIQGMQGADGPAEVRYRAHVAFKLAEDLMQRLSSVHDRRKAVVLISSGYDFDPFAASRSGATAGTPFLSNPMADDSSMTNRFADADLAMEMREVTNAANRANVSWYAFDPRGLVAGQDLDEQVDPVDWETHLRKSQDSLRVIAEETGGIAVVNTNDFDKAIRRIDAETSDYYVLGYYSKNPDPTRRRREIEIRVTKKDQAGESLDLMYRREYTLRPIPAPSAPPQ
jgi:VWFA-related protein